MTVCRQVITDPKFVFRFSPHVCKVAAVSTTNCAKIALALVAPSVAVILMDSHVVANPSCIWARPCNTGVRDRLGAMMGFSAHSGTGSGSSRMSGSCNISNLGVLITSGDHLGAFSNVGKLTGSTPTSSNLRFPILPDETPPEPSLSKTFSSSNGNSCFRISLAACVTSFMLSAVPSREAA